MIYNGLPVGKYNGPLVQAYAEALSSVLDKAPSKVAVNEPAR